MGKMDVLLRAVKNAKEVIRQFNDSVAWDLDWQRQTPEIEMCLECIDRVSEGLWLALTKIGES